MRRAFAPQQSSARDTTRFGGKSDRSERRRQPTPSPCRSHRNGSFLLLWAGQFVSQMGDRLAALAFPWLVYTTTGSALGTGAVFALYTLPYVLFGALAGVVVDRFDKRRLMIAVDLVRDGPRRRRALRRHALAAGGLRAELRDRDAQASSSSRPSWPSCPRSSRRGGCCAPTRSSRPARTSPRSSAGPSPASLLASVSTSVAFRLDAVTFAVSAAALLLMRYRAPARAAAENTARAVWHELREGFRFLRTRPRPAREHHDDRRLRRGPRRLLPADLPLRRRGPATAGPAPSAPWKRWSEPATSSARWRLWRSPRACARAGS